MNNIIKKFKLKRKTSNARKWKHKDGGVLFAGTGLKVNNFLSSDLGKSIVNGVGLLYNGIKSNSLLSKAQSEFDTSLKYKKKFMLDSYLNSPDLSYIALSNLEQRKLENPDLNFSKLDYQQELRKLLSEVLSQIVPQIDYELSLERNLFNENMSAIKGENTNSLITGIFNIGKTALLNYQNKKLSSN